MLDDLIRELIDKLNKEINLNNFKLYASNDDITDYAYNRVLELFEDRLSLEDYLEYCDNKYKLLRDVLNNIKGL